MARKVVETNSSEVFTESQLTDLVNSYAKNKDILKQYKDQTDKENADIKTAMKQLIAADKDGKRSYSTDNYVATFSEIDKSVMNEDKLITWLKKNKLGKGIIKKKEYVDSNALESAIYNGLITQEQLIEMESCKDISTQERLTISKNKGGK